MTAIDVNGQAREIAPQSTLLDLVGQLQLAGQPLALAVNRTVVPRAQWAAHALRDGDKVDIVRAIGGG